MNISRTNQNQFQAPARPKSASNPEQDSAPQAVAPQESFEISDTAIQIASGIGVAALGFAAGQGEGILPAVAGAAFGAAGASYVGLRIGDASDSGGFMPGLVGGIFGAGIGGVAGLATGAWAGFSKASPGLGIAMGLGGALAGYGWAHAMTEGI